ncbi:UNVERIFIED_CONTAM: Cyclic nucleotide-gated ion channel 17 [Sesamum calycinum]|uniref:Cyclic nucleotide-gated ion channel 17 n=1 Tax=Sesamum calycinum TaxID=2727403 RepID=A0AAW2RSX6_9LAMI
MPSENEDEERKACEKMGLLISVGFSDVNRFCSDGKQEKGFMSWGGKTGSSQMEKSSAGHKLASSLLNSEGKCKIVDSLKFGGSKVFPEDHEPLHKHILDPGSDIVLNWNRVFIVSCLLALFVDPLYFYLPSIGGSKDSWTAYVAPSSRVFGRGELVRDPKKIAQRYIRSDFFIDLVATLPLPQIVIWFIIPATRNHRTNHNNNALALIVLFQYIPRLYLIFPLSSQIIKATGVVTKTAWAGAAYNLLLYMLASHVLGAACSYGQNLSTSTFIGETSFSILIAILGLVLFAHLIGNMQTYLQSLTVRLEEWRLKRRDTEEWMRHRQLPEDLRKRVRRFVQYKWLATRGVDEEAILRGLPADLSRDIQRHLCLDLVRRVPFFSQMDDQLLDAICERLVSSLCTEGTYIVREGDPVTEMLFIIRGRLESSTTNGGRTGFFNSITLRPGDFCGEELLAWALLPKSAVILPSSTRTVRALVEVEAFALRAEDLKFVANQFRRLHSKKLQHTFRFYSHHWRTWAACFIQAAWRRYKRRKMVKDLARMESFVLDETTEDNTEEEELDQSPNSSTPSKIISNLGVTILASRFAANTRRGVQKIKDQLPKTKPESLTFRLSQTTTPQLRQL